MFRNVSDGKKKFFEIIARLSSSEVIWISSSLLLSKTHDERSERWKYFEVECLSLELILSIDDETTMMMQWRISEKQQRQSRYQHNFPNSSASLTTLKFPCSHRVSIFIVSNWFLWFPGSTWVFKYLSKSRKGARTTSITIDSEAKLKWEKFMNGISLRLSDIDTIKL